MEEKKKKMEEEKKRLRLERQMMAKEKWLIMRMVREVSWEILNDMVDTGQSLEMMAMDFAKMYIFEEMDTAEELDTGDFNMEVEEAKEIVEQQSDPVPVAFTQPLEMSISWWYLVSNSRMPVSISKSIYKFTQLLSILPW